MGNYDNICIPLYTFLSLCVSFYQIARITDTNKTSILDISVNLFMKRICFRIQASWWNNVKPECSYDHWLYLFDRIFPYQYKMPLPVFCLMWRMGWVRPPVGLCGMVWLEPYFFSLRSSQNYLEEIQFIILHNLDIG